MSNFGSFGLIWQVSGNVIGFTEIFSAKSSHRENFWKWSIGYLNLPSLLNTYSSTVNSNRWYYGHISILNGLQTYKNIILQRCKSPGVAHYFANNRCLRTPPNIKLMLYPYGEDSEVRMANKLWLSAAWKLYLRKLQASAQKTNSSGPNFNYLLQKVFSPEKVLTWSIHY